MQQVGFKVDVSYNGVERNFGVLPHEQVQVLLQQAITAFGIGRPVHAMALFRANGTQIDPNQTIQAAGIKPDDELYLRQIVVQGGGA